MEQKKDYKHMKRTKKIACSHSVSVTISQSGTNVISTHVSTSLSGEGRLLASGQCFSKKISAIWTLTAYRGTTLTTVANKRVNNSNKKSFPELTSGTALSKSLKQVIIGHLLQHPQLTLSTCFILSQFTFFSEKIIWYHQLKLNVVSQMFSPPALFAFMAF